ncbi:MAG: methionyl-tRNA formyltransferase [Pseudomonadales bacterium]|nr:methionyl-tRNA formyltransferase [Pseudomonadales bacterium]
MQALKIVFAGTPPFAATHLQALINSPHEVVAVYTQPDRAAGRGKQLQASPVKLLALEHGIPVHQPQSLRAQEEQQVLASIGADVMVVVAYGLILPQAVLDIPRLGCLNVHASLLPRWRGAAPIERALLAGDPETGVTLMQMDKGLDTGDMLAKAILPITADDDRQTLEDGLADIGCRTLVSSLAILEQLREHAEKQDDSLSTYASKLSKEEALIDWNASAETINRIIRCGIGRNPAYSFLQGERVRLLKATLTGETGSRPPGTIFRADSEGICVACLNSSLNIQIMQFPGKIPLPVRDLLNSKKELLCPGRQFTSSDDTAP